MYQMRIFTLPVVNKIGYPSPSLDNYNYPQTPTSIQNCLNSWDNKQRVFNQGGCSLFFCSRVGQVRCLFLLLFCGGRVLNRSKVACKLKGCTSSWKIFVKVLQTIQYYNSLYGSDTNANCVVVSLITDSLIFDWITHCWYIVL